MVDSAHNELVSVAGDGGELLGLETQVADVDSGPVQSDVGELAVVGRAHGVDVVHVERVAVHVVASRLGDGRCLVPRLHQRVVVDGETSQTLGVLVEERSVGQGVNVDLLADTTIKSNVAQGVVRPVRRYSGILDGEQKSLDSVGEADIQRALLLTIGSERVHKTARGGLDLLNQDITRSTTHTLTLVVGHDGILGPDVAVQQGGALSSKSIVLVDNDHIAVLSLSTGDGSTRVHDEQLSPVAELELDAHLVVRQGSSGKSHTRVASEEEGERQVEGETGQHRGGLGEHINVTNHVVVANLLRGGHSEGRPEVKVPVVKTGSHKVVKGDGSLLHKVVGKVVGPANLGIVVSTVLAGGVNSHRGDGTTEPSMDEVITSTRDAGSPLLAETRLAHVLRQNSGDQGEPGRLASVAHKVGSSLGATIDVLLQLIKRGKIDKSGSNRLID